MDITTERVSIPVPGGSAMPAYLARPKGGVELARQPSLAVLPHALAAIALSAARSPHRVRRPRRTTRRATAPAA